MTENHDPPEVLSDAESKGNALEAGQLFRRDSVEYDLGYSFSFFWKKALSKSIGIGMMIVEFFSVETSVKV